MHIGILLPGFSRDEHDAAIPVQLNLVRELAQHESVRVLALRYPFERCVYTVVGAKVHALGAGPVRGLRRVALWADTLFTLYRLHRAQPFDLLHAMWADETGLIAAWAGRMMQVPVVVSVAGGEPVWLPDIGYGLQGSAFSRWTVRQALQGADRVVVASEYTKRKVEEITAERQRIREAEGILNAKRQRGKGAKQSVIHSGKLTCIPLGVDAEHFRPTESIKPSTTHLIHVGSLIGVKDQAMLLRALARLPGEVTVEIIGEGPERERLEQLAAAVGVLKRVQFAGAVPHTDLPSHYQRACLHVLTSRHEGQGMVTLEAAACGLPTVSTAVGLVPDDPALGVSVPAGDDATLAAAILMLLNDPQRLQHMSQVARAAVETRYTIQHSAARLRALYQELITRA
jgi:glycosyltransferase involved in cell wall biosynthesis